MSEEQTNEIYQEELKHILKVWVFNFRCINCESIGTPANHKYLTDESKSNKRKGFYGKPPTIWCGCHEMLYVVRSHGLFELISALFGKDKDGFIVIRGVEEPEYTEEDEKPVVF